MRMFETSRRAAGWMRLTVMLAVLGAGRTWGADSSNAAAGGSDPLLDLFVQKGFVTQAEAEKVKAEADLMRTNGTQMPPFPESKWKISDGIKNVDLFGDVRLRYEGRTARDPEGIKSDSIATATHCGWVCGERPWTISIMVSGWKPPQIPAPPLTPWHRLVALEQQSGL